MIEIKGHHMTITTAQTLFPHFLLIYIGAGVVALRTGTNNVTMLMTPDELELLGKEIERYTNLQSAHMQAEPTLESIKPPL